MVFSAVGTLARPLVGGKGVLHLIESCWIDEWFVAAGVLNALPSDIAEVVPIAQDFVQFVGGQRSGGPVGCWALRQPSTVECGRECPKGPDTGGVLFECPLNVVSSVGIGSDGSYFAPVHCFAHVEVSNGRNGWGAATQGLLFGAFHYFVGQVAAVELGDAGHDAVQQCPAGCGIDVLGNADQRGASSLYCQSDLHIVRAAAREPVEFMYNDVGGGGGSKICQHPLQLRTIR
ncbi:Uncharacterised protein [Mycobacteroides abscessus subsp. massiliense]|nr:Uncharacterised protein [Mycobacteroides abscessus subsp. massiliense]